MRRLARSRSVAADLSVQNRMGKSAMHSLDGKLLGLRLGLRQQEHTHQCKHISYIAGGAPERGGWGAAAAADLQLSNGLMDDVLGHTSHGRVVLGESCQLRV